MSKASLDKNKNEDMIPEIAIKALEEINQIYKDDPCSDTYHFIRYLINNAIPAEPIVYKEAGKTKLFCSSCTEEFTKYYDSRGGSIVFCPECSKRIKGKIPTKNNYKSYKKK